MKVFEAIIQQDREACGIIGCESFVDCPFCDNRIFDEDPGLYTCGDCGNEFRIAAPDPPDIREGE